MNKQNQFKAFFIYQYRNFFTRRNLAVIVLFVLVAMFFVQNGVNEYNRNRPSQPEEPRLSQALAPVCILFYNNIEGSRVFLHRGMRVSDFTGFLYMMGALVLMFYGFDTFRNIPFMRMLESHTGRLKLFWLMMASRYLLMNLLFMTLMGMAVLMITAHGVALLAIDLSVLAGYVWMWQLFSVIYFISGAFMGLMPERITGKSGKVALLSSWVVLFYLVPMALDAVMVGTVSARFMVSSLILLSVSAVLCQLTLLLFRKAMVHTKLDDDYKLEFMDAEIILQRGTMEVFQVKDSDRIDLFYALLTQPMASLTRKGLNSILTLEGEPLPPPKSKRTITGDVAVQYFAAPGSLPGDVTTKNLLALFCRLTGNCPDKLETLLESQLLEQLDNVQLSDLSNHEQACLILAIAQMKPGSYYLFDNTATGADFGFTMRFRQVVQELKDTRATIIYLTGNETVSLSRTRGGLEKVSYWMESVKSLAKNNN